MPARIVAITLLLAVLPGCAVARFPKNHPKITGLVGGVAIGSVVAYRQRMVTCTYDGGSVGRYPAGQCPKDSDSRVAKR